MRQESPKDVIAIGPWQAARTTGELAREGAVERLEPKVMDLLFLLASKPGRAFTKDEIMTALWPDVVVGDDTLARAISRLRKALGDDPKNPIFIETLPKRGYRLIAEVNAVEAPTIERLASVQRAPRRIAPPAAFAMLAVAAVLAAFVWSTQTNAPDSRAVLVERANDFYFQYKRADNEAATALFDRILADRPDYAPALAGLANALVQKVIRWPDAPGAPEYTKLGDAFLHGRTKTVESVTHLAHARVLAERAVALAPQDPAAHKALGFVQSASGEFAEAIASYKRAVALDPDAWGPLINIGDVLEISGRSRDAIPYFEQAYAAMTRVYDKQSARVRPWYAELAVLIGDRHRDQGDVGAAETWYRRVLVYAPLHLAATEHLAALLRRAGDTAGANQLCATLSAHVGATCGL